MMIALGIGAIAFTALHKPELPLPYYLQDICRDDCCKPGQTLTAQQDVNLLRANNDPAVLTSVKKDEVVKLMQSLAKVIKPGSYKLNKDHIFQITDPATGKDSELKIKAGERILELADLGHNDFEAMFDKKRYRLNFNKARLAGADVNYNFPNYSHQTGETEWWVQVQKANGEIGWTRWDARSFTDADKCDVSTKSF